MSRSPHVSLDPPSPIPAVDQVCDVEIDRINKPYLPIPAGRLSRPTAKLIVGASLVLGFALPLIFYPFDK
jgi:homogentisate phytyltransferase/homogentisate geranylgeranyltransferase